MTEYDIKLFHGRSNPAFAQAIAREVGVKTSNPIIPFNDGEFSVGLDSSVRHSHCFILQPTCPPVARSVLELLVMLDALNRASAAKITAVVPYFGFARQDRKTAPRAPITASLLMDLLDRAGGKRFERILTVDLHAGQTQGSFPGPVDDLEPTPIFATDINERYGTKGIVLGFTDVGGAKRYEHLAKLLNLPIVIVDKRRPRVGVSKTERLIGNVKNKFVLLIDDIVDTAGSLCGAANLIMKKGASGVAAYITHPLFSKNRGTGEEAIDLICRSPLKEIVVGDTVPLRRIAKKCDKVRVISFAHLVGQAIKNIHERKSVSGLIKDIHSAI